MIISYLKIGFITLLTCSLSSVALARHSVDVNIKIDRDSMRGVSLSHVKLRHHDDKYRLEGEVRRRQNNPVSIGHFDLVASDLSANMLYEDSEFYWPRIVNRKYNRPSKFVFTIPEEMATQAELRLSFHKDKLSKRPRPSH